MNEYIAPKLTKYGKIENIIQAGSVPLQTGDLTGDGIADKAFDTNGDGKADVIIGGANGGQTPVTFIGNASKSGDDFDFYDSDGDNLPDFVIGNLSSKSQYLQTIDDFTQYYVVFTFDKIYRNAVPNSGITAELSSNGDWNDPARD